MIDQEIISQKKEEVIAAAKWANFNKWKSLNATKAIVDRLAELRFLEESIEWKLKKIAAFRNGWDTGVCKKVCQLGEKVCSRNGDVCSMRIMAGIEAVERLIENETIESSTEG